MGPQINKQQVETTVKYVSIGKDEGAKIAIGGNRLSGDKLGRGWFHEPTIFTNAHAKMRIAQEEIFGPVTTVISMTSVEEAADIANSTMYGLSSAIYTKDINKAFRAIRDINAGITYVNAPTIGAEVHLPFGGVKATGNGHREGSQAIDFFSTWKAVYIDYSDKLQRAQIDNE
jgi:alpha-ketoglutaric semialdehyde dehydrogenase